MSTQVTTKIGSEREYQITLRTIGELEQGLVEQERFRARRDPAEHWLVVGGMEGMLADLCQQAAEYKPTDGRAYQATLAAIRRFESYVQQLEEVSEQLAPSMLGLLRENTQNFLDDLRTQVAEYDVA